MSFMDKRKGNALKDPPKSDALPEVPGLVNELFPIEQLPFPGSTSTPATISEASPAKQPLMSNIFEASPLTTRQLPGITMPLPSSAATRLLPEVTRMLPETRIDTSPLQRGTTSALRQTTVIRATGKKSSGTMRPPQGRRMVVHVAVTVLLAFIVIGSLLAVIPTGIEGKGYNPFSPLVKYFTNKSSNTVLLAQQAATATAVTQDGYDPGANKVFAGVPTAPPIYKNGGGGGTGGGGTSGGGTSGGTSGGGGGVTSGGGGASDGVGNHFFWGQCTWWAAFRYHQLTNHYPPWLGNAGDWAYNAVPFGWVVSSTPHLHSIIVLAPGVQGAGSYGHVAIVESINADGSLTTSNFNWAGNFGIMTYVTFYPGPGVSFILIFSIVLARSDNAQSCFGASFVLRLYPHLHVRCDMPATSVPLQPL